MANPEAGLPATARRDRPAEVAARFQQFRTRQNAGFYDALAAFNGRQVDHPCLTLHFEYAATAARVGPYLARAASAPRATAEEQRGFLLDYAPGFWMVLARRAS